MNRILGTYGKIMGETSGWFRNVVHVFEIRFIHFKKFNYFSLHNVTDWFYMTDRVFPAR